MGWFFSKNIKKEEFEQLKQAVQTGFNNVKQDFKKTSTWIKHLDNRDIQIKDEIYELHDEISTLKEEIENLKNIISMFGDARVFKQRQTVFNKQTAVQGVLNSVQTGVQTAFFDNLSPTERAIIIVLLNSDMKLSYEDLSAMMGKSKATIRGQINSIKQKSEGLIEEQVSENGKKRVYIPEETKEKLLKIKKIKGKKKKKNNLED